MISKLISKPISQDQIRDTTPGSATRSLDCDHVTRHVIF